MNELRQCPFCGGDAEKRYIKRKKDHSENELYSEDLY